MDLTTVVIVLAILLAINLGISHANAFYILRVYELLTSQFGDDTEDNLGECKVKLTKAAQDYIKKNGDKASVEISNMVSKEYKKYKKGKITEEEFDNLIIDNDGKKLKMVPNVKDLAEAIEEMADELSNEANELGCQLKKLQSESKSKYSNDPIIYDPDNNPEWSGVTDEEWRSNCKFMNDAAGLPEGKFVTIDGDLGNFTEVAKTLELADSDIGEIELDDGASVADAYFELNEHEEYAEEFGIHTPHPVDYTIKFNEDKNAIVFGAIDLTDKDIDPAVLEFIKEDNDGLFDLTLFPRVYYEYLLDRVMGNEEPEYPCKSITYKDCTLEYHDPKVDSIIKSSHIASCIALQVLLQEYVGKLGPDGLAVTPCNIYTKYELVLRYSYNDEYDDDDIVENRGFYYLDLQRK